MANVIVPSMTTDTSTSSVSTGPRALRLVDTNASLPPRLSTTPPHSPSSPALPPSPAPSPGPPRTNGTRAARRQSSISYKSSERERDPSFRSPPSSSGVTRTLSLVVPKSPHSPGLPASDRHSTGSVTPERPPLTLPEKHAELLQFIAQKESKCMELRAQLAVHEAELLQLKRRWERIVARKFDRVSGITDHSSTSSIGVSQGGTMLEGIKGSVQGVSRFITAGLGELAASSQPPPTPSHQRSSTQSNSSVSTSTTKSTRFSQSSVSSLADEPPAQDEDAQVLITHGAGATPITSPNLSTQEQEQNGQPSSFEEVTTDGYQRKSGETTARSPLGPSSSSLSVHDVKQKREAQNAHRLSLPPAGSIPGLTLATSGITAPPLSSWIGNMGKKLGEIQRGSTFTKSQKRASVLLSDVSQTIASALSPSPSPSPVLRSAKSDGLSPSKSSKSLLDDDDPLGSSLAEAITPDPAPTSTTKTHSALQPDDEDEWNW